MHSLVAVIRLTANSDNQSSSVPVLIVNTVSVLTNNNSIFRV
jgi:hypothetical protein